ncbi:hypothetical protein NFI96_000254 [Prochilodus magdalenae]|nr:hypothetical protein NFI96_000254 [Prochilodus magdalenae]
MGKTLALTLLLLLGFTPAQNHDPMEFHRESPEDFNIKEDNFTVSAIIERANKNLGKSLGDPTIKFGDIVVEDGLENADKCSFQNPGCKWPRQNDGKVYVPYIISNQYSSDEKKVIRDALNSFEKVTCIRFRRRKREEDYIHIQSLKGCYSSVGRRGGKQDLSLDRSGCVYKKVVQHELLHALGFHHEQCRSDRDKHVHIAYENVRDGQQHNFDVRDTNNLGTHYDYGSVMHYERFAFSKNGQPTMIPIPDPNAEIGYATEMNNNDILRVNKLYYFNIKEDDFTVSALIERANKNLGKALGGPTIEFGDIVVKDGLENADKCSFQNPGCKWPGQNDGKVYVPYIISNQFGSNQRQIIKDALNSFEKVTCIRFRSCNREEDYIHIQSLGGGTVVTVFHLDKKNTYVRTLFVDYSSAFNTIVPSRLDIKLRDLGLNSSLCSWILNCLTDRRQVVKLAGITSSSLTLSTGAPQGCVLSPLLYSLYTHDCTARHSSNVIIKFADDTTIVGLISNNNEEAYREEVSFLTHWCWENNLSLIINKTKELKVDFRKQERVHTPITIDGAAVERVSSFKFLGVHITEELTWTEHTTRVVKKAQQRLFFLRRLRRFGMDPRILRTFYTCTVESILTGSITTWYGSCTAIERKALQRVVRTA